MIDSEQAMNKTLDFIKFFAFIAIVYFVIYAIFNYVPFVAKYDHMVIVTDSMEPIINVGDLVIINTDVDHSSIERNDIYAFYVDLDDNGSEELVVHFIDQVNKLGDENLYKTRPNVSNAQDSWTLEERDMVGEYVFRLPKIGKGILFLGSGLGKAVIIFDIIVVYLLVGAFKQEEKKSEDIFDDIDVYNK